MMFKATTISQKTALILSTPSVLVPVALPKNVPAAFTCSPMLPLSCTPPVRYSQA